MSTRTVLITDYTWPSLDPEAAILRRADAELVVAETGDEEELLQLVVDADAILTCFAQVTDRVVNAGERLQVIGRYGIGVDNIAVGEATRRGIPVTNVPAYCIDEVAEHTLAMALALARNIGSYNRSVRDDDWSLIQGRPLYRIAGQTFGIVGYGKIGQALGHKAIALGLKVLAHDPLMSDAAIAAAGAEAADLPTLVSRADFLSVHVPLTAETRGLIGDRLLRSMKPTAFVINTARGGVIDQDALDSRVGQRMDRRSRPRRIRPGATCARSSTAHTTEPDRHPSRRLLLRRVSARSRGARRRERCCDSDRTPPALGRQPRSPRPSPLGPPAELTRVRTNHVRQRLRNGQATIGCFLGLGSPSVAELLAHAGFDWLIVETEHNAVDIAQVEHMLMAINGTDAIPLVRVPSSDPIAIQRALDVGALGVVVPFVKTADEAAAIVAATRYPPDGRRGFGPLRAANYTFGNADYLATANDNILVVLILETREAVENLDAIASVPGVDVVYLGPADLSLAYGLQPFDSAADQTIADVLAAAVDVSRRTGIAVGHGAASAEQVRLRYDQGVTMIGYGPDYGLLATAARSGIEALPLPTSHSRDHDARDES